MKNLNKFLFLILFLCALFIGCKKDKQQPMAPTVVTGTATVAGGTVTLSGEIIGNGGSEITATGFVYSSTNTMPTIAADSFTEEIVTSGVFSSKLEGLTSSTSYYVRAYAINSKGAGYGAVVNFTTGNSAPTASNVTITGKAEVNGKLTATYTYTDSEGNAESGTTFQWYVANDATGAGETAISGATLLTYTVAEAQQGKYIRIGITPKAATGTTTGTEVKSTFVGAVGEATTITFMYNGKEVTYGIINSSTGRKWLDRNLGAPNAPTAHNDYANYGDLFQWGRGADGHQLIIINGPNGTDMVAVNGKTLTTPPFAPSSSDNPGHSLFIVNGNAPADWRIPQNNNLWQGVNGINNPCPTGWRIATIDEWLAENLQTIGQAYTKLKITFTGARGVDTGDFLGTTSGRYWTSTVDGDYSWRIIINDSGVTPSSFFVSRGIGYPCRCIKN